VFAQKYVEIPEECLIEAADREAFAKLKSALISSYEVALESGLSPGGALAVILDWVAVECGRLNVR
jgi:hypothetical protein